MFLSRSKQRSAQDVFDFKDLNNLDNLGKSHQYQKKYDQHQNAASMQSPLEKVERLSEGMEKCRKMSEEKGAPKLKENLQPGTLLQAIQNKPPKLRTASARTANNEYSACSDSHRSDSPDDGKRIFSPITSYLEVYLVVERCLLSGESSRKQFEAGQKMIQLPPEQLVLDMIRALSEASSHCEDLGPEASDITESPVSELEEEKGDTSSCPEKCCSIRTTGSVKSSKEKKKITFPSSSLEMLTTPNIGIERSEAPCFNVIAALYQACEKAESLSHLVRAHCKQTVAVLQKTLEILKRYEYQTKYFVCACAFVQETVQWILGHVEELNVKQKLYTAVETGIRFILRKLFNKPIKRYYASDDEQDILSDSFDEFRVAELEFLGMGSYEFNNDDVAALIRDALVILFDTTPSTRNWQNIISRHQAENSQANHFDDDDEGSLLSSSFAGYTDNQLDELEGLVPSCYMFVHSYGFLSELFLENPNLSLAILEKRDLLSLFELCSNVVQTFQMEAQYPFLVLRNPYELMDHLNGLALLASDLRNWLEEYEEAAASKCFVNSSRKRTHYAIDREAQDKAAAFQFPDLSVSSLNLPTRVSTFDDDSDIISNASMDENAVSKGFLYNGIGTFCAFCNNKERSSSLPWRCQECKGVFHVSCVRCESGQAAPLCSRCPGLTTLQINNLG